MHHYERNIGDYLRDAAHLSLLEHGIYTRLLDIYYLNEKPLPLDLKVIARQIGARSQDELDALTNVLSDFFQKTEHGYRQKRCDKELEKIYEKSEKARQSAASRWGKTETASPEKCERNANAMPSDSERNANGMLPITHNPDISNTNVLLANKPDDLFADAKKIEDCPASEIIQIWREVLPELPTPEKLTDARRKAIRARWREYPDMRNLDAWRKCFHHIRGSPFLMGRVSSAGREPLALTVDWFFSPSKFQKFREGFYHRGANA